MSVVARTREGCGGEVGGLPFTIVTVFVDEENNNAGGNQLLVVNDPTGRMTSESMQKAAKEIDFAESIFISGPLKTDDAAGGTEGRLAVRIFTTDCEVPFAGHPLVGVAEAASHFGILKGSAVKLSLQGGKDEVLLSRFKSHSWRFARRPPPDPSLPSAPPPIFPRDVLQLLSLSCKSEDFFHQCNTNSDGKEIAFPEVSMGLPYIMIRVRDRSSLSRARPASDQSRITAALKLLERAPPTPTAAFYFYWVEEVKVAEGGKEIEKEKECKKKHERSGVDEALQVADNEFPSPHLGTGTVVHSRMYCRWGDGIVEDAATGSAAAALGAHLKCSAPSLLPLRIIQGEDMGRRSILNLDYDIEKGVVLVGGRVKLVAEGVWHEV